MRKQYLYLWWCTKRSTRTEIFIVTPGRLIDFLPKGTTNLRQQFDRRFSKFLCNYVQVTLQRTIYGERKQSIRF